MHGCASIAPPRIGVGQGGTKTLCAQACARAGSITLLHFDEMCLNAHARKAARGWAQGNPDDGAGLEFSTACI